jgi:hypothetical protein
MSDGEDYGALAQCHPIPDSSMPHPIAEPISADAADTLDVEIPFDFDGEMNDGLPVVPGMEMVSFGDLDGDNQVHQGTHTMVTRPVLPSPFYRAQCSPVRASRGGGSFCYVLLLEG